MEENRQGSLVTAQDAQTIMDVWAEFRTHRPFKEYALHEVIYSKKGSTEVIVCEDYIIKDNLATFKNVRVKTSFNVTDIAVAKLAVFYDSHLYNHRRDCIYTQTRVSQKKVWDFPVSGYVVKGDKTINATQIESIDSLDTVSSNDWYAITEEAAIVLSAESIIEHNKNINNLNQYQMSEENIKIVVEALKQVVMVSTNDDLENAWLDKIRKCAWKWVGKLKYPKPKYLTVPEPLTKEFCNKYLKVFYEHGFSSYDGVDAKYLDMYMSAGQKPKNITEDAEYTEVK